MASGAFQERLRESWAEIRENLGRSALQSLGVMLGVASVLGGFSITDSFRQRSEKMYVLRGGLDKLNIQPAPVASEGTPSAMKNANLGLREEDRQDGELVKKDEQHGVSVSRGLRARVRSAAQDQERFVQGIGGDYLALEGFEIEQGRGLSAQDQANAAPVALLGTEAAQTFFPSGNALGQVLRVGDTPVQIVGLLRERVFRFSKTENGGRNIFWRQNRLIAVPASFVQRRVQGDLNQRLDRVTFRLPRVDAMAAFSQELKNVLKANHRQEEDFRLDDVAARIRKQRNNGDAYNLIFMLSGVLALLGGGLVNVNIQLASLKERVREVGVKMALGAPGREVFKTFMTEALLLTGLGAFVGLFMGIAFSWAITGLLGVPLAMSPASFIWAYILATVFGFCFALFPAWKASRLSPMEALRYE